MATRSPGAISKLSLRSTGAALGSYASVTSTNLIRPRDGFGPSTGRSGGGATGKWSSSLCNELNALMRATHPMLVSNSTHLCTTCCDVDGIKPTISTRIAIKPALSWAASIE